MSSSMRPSAARPVEANEKLSGDTPLPQLESLSEVARAHILRTLEACHGQRSLAAQVLQIDRKTLYRRLRSYGL